MSLVSLTLRPPRNAFTPRDTARAGDLWRLLQDAAVLGSSALGWTPERYREVGSAFVVRKMVVVHHREVGFGVDLPVRTWVSSFRRAILSHRQIRIADARGPLLSATQEWVHVAVPEVRVQRAGPELTASFAVHEDGPDVALPAADPVPDRPTHTWSLRCWHTWMDPLGHANHPAYVDWIDEAISIRLAEAGVDPVRLVPVAEEVVFRHGVVAGQEVVIGSCHAATTEDGQAVITHTIETGDGRPCAAATTVRTLVGDPDDLTRAWE